MPTVRVALQTIELRDTEALVQLDITATANGTTMGHYAPRSLNYVTHLPRTFQADVEVAEGGEIAIVVQLTARRAVSFSAPVPAEGQAIRHEQEDVTITATLLPLTSGARTRGRASRGAGGGRATISLGGTPAAVRVEIVHPIDTQSSCPTEGQVAEIVRMGLWENAWDGDRFRNEATDDDHFIGLDPRRFYVRVVDRGARTPTVNVSVRTLLGGHGGGLGGPHDDNQGEPLITCTAAPGARGVFVSRALMLVSSATDLEARVHAGDIPGGGIRRRGEQDYRLRRASMFGHVEATYEGASEPGRAELFGRERRRIRLTLYDVNAARDSARRPMDEVFLTDLRVAREVYGRLGIWVWTAPASEVSASRRETHRGSGGTDHISHVILGRPPHGDAWNMSEAQVAIASEHPPDGSPSGLRAFYFPDMGTAVNGQSWTRAYLTTRDTRDQPALNTSFINTPRRGPYTLAHEMLHLLVDSAGTTSPEQHYRGTDVAHNLLSGAGMSAREAWNGTCRIREEQVRDILRNLAWIE
jgi:hypothetical protein